MASELCGDADLNNALYQVSPGPGLAGTGTLLMGTLLTSRFTPVTLRDVGSIDDFLTFRLFADFVEFANFVFL